MKFLYFLAVLLVGVLPLPMHAVDVPAPIAPGSPIKSSQLTQLGELEKKDLETNRFSVTEGTFYLSGSTNIDSDLECQYLMPKALGKDSISSNVLFIFHTPGDKTPLKAEWVRKIVSAGGIPAFSIYFPKSSDCGLFFQDDAKMKFYVFPQSGSYAVILSALGLLREKFNLGKGKMYLSGFSAGGIGVQRFAEEYPTAVAGVVSICGSSFVLKNNPRSPFLILHTYGDPGQISGERLLTRYLENGNAATRALVEPNWNEVENGNVWAFHSMPGTSQNLAKIYILSLDRLSQKEGGDLSRARFPYACIADAPDVVWSSINEDRFKEAVANGQRIMSIPSAAFYAQLTAQNSPIQTISGKGFLAGISPANDGDPKKPRASIFLELSKGTDTLDSIRVEYDCLMRYASSLGRTGGYYRGDADSLANGIAAIGKSLPGLSKDALSLFFSEDILALPASPVASIRADKFLFIDSTSLKGLLDTHRFPAWVKADGFTLLVLNYKEAEQSSYLTVFVDILGKYKTIPSTDHAGRMDNLSAKLKAQRLLLGQ